MFDGVGGSSSEGTALTFTFGTLVFVETFILLLMIVGFLMVVWVVVLHLGCGWKISKGIFPRRGWLVVLRQTLLPAVGSLFLIGAAGGCRSTLLTRRLSTIGFCVRGITTGLITAVLCTIAGEFILLSVGKIFDSRWRLFESKRRVNSSFFSCIAGVSSELINGGDILGNKFVGGTINDFVRSADGKSVIGIINDFVRFEDDVSVPIGGKGVYDGRIVSARLSHNVSNVSSRRSCVESTGIPVWRW